MDSSTDSKRERRLAARAERQRQADEGRRKAHTRRRLTLGGLVLLAVVALAGLVFFASQTLFKPQPGRAVASEGRDHVNPGTPLSFTSSPPSSGTHYPSWTRPGLYTEPQDPGNWVHSLEHGYISILYNCPAACPELVQQLRQFYESAPKSTRYGYQKLVVTPYPALEGRLAAVAWGRVLELEQFDAQRLLEFYNAYRDRGPEDAS